MQSVSVRGNIWVLDGSNVHQTSHREALFLITSHNPQGSLSVICLTRSSPDCWHVIKQNTFFFQQSGWSVNLVFYGKQEVTRHLHTHVGVTHTNIQWNMLWYLQISGELGNQSVKETLYIEHKADPCCVQHVLKTTCGRQQTLLSLITIAAW